MRVLVATAKKPRAARWRRLLGAVSAEAVEIPELSLLEKAVRSDERALALVDLYLLDTSGRPLESLQAKLPRLELVVFGDEQALFGRGLDRALRVGASDFLHDGLADKELKRLLKERIDRLSGSRGKNSLESQDGNLQVDRRSRTVRLREKSGWKELASFTPKEFEILCVLLDQQGRPVSRQELMQRVWGRRSGDVNLEADDKQVAALRKKLGADGKRIKTRRGVGYSFSGP